MYEKFEQKGINFQNEATSKEEALRFFQYSCDCCSYRGIRLDCDRCRIAHVHSLVVAYFDDEEAKKEAKANGN